MNARGWLYSIVALALCALPASAQWVKTSGPDSVRVFARGIGNPYNLYVYAGTRTGIYRNSDATFLNWAPRNTGLSFPNVRSLIVLNPESPSGLLFAGTDGGGIFRSVDTSATWAAVNNGLKSLYVRALAFNGASILFAGTDSGVYRSYDSGASWAAVNNGLVSWNVRALVVSGIYNSTGVLVATDSGVFRSTNNGSNWVAFNASLSNRNVQALGITDGNIYAGTPTGTFSYRGFGWENSFSIDSVYNTFSPNVVVLSGLGYPANNVGPIAGTQGFGVLMSQNGDMWTQINQGLTEFDIDALFASSNGYQYMLAGTEKGIWRRPVYDINGSWGAIEGEFGSPTRLRFSPAGFVSFTLPSAARVTLEAFTPEGYRAAVLLSEELPAGEHSRRLKTEALANGLYVYRLRAGNLVETRKVMLTR